MDCGPIIDEQKMLSREIHLLGLCICSVIQGMEMPYDFANDAKEALHGFVFVYEHIRPTASLEPYPNTKQLDVRLDCLHLLCKLVPVVPWRKWFVIVAHTGVLRKTFNASSAVVTPITL